MLEAINHKNYQISRFGCPPQKIHNASVVPEKANEDNIGMIRNDEVLQDNHRKYLSMFRF
jgi:hypothetical protein